MGELLPTKKVAINSVQHLTVCKTSKESLVDTFASFQASSGYQDGGCVMVEGIKRISDIVVKLSTMLYRNDSLLDVWISN